MFDIVVVYQHIGVMLVGGIVHLSCTSRDEASCANAHTPLHMGHIKGRSVCKWDERRSIFPGFKTICKREGPIYKRELYANGG